jgi:hypothetical protein
MAVYPNPVTGHVLYPDYEELDADLGRVWVRNGVADTAEKMTRLSTGLSRN